MDKQTEVKKIWQERFSDTREWMAEVFSRIYSDDDALLLTDSENNAVSSMLLRRYEMCYGSAVIPVSYIYGAATRRGFQGRGYMSDLMARALNESYRRGELVSCLIPGRRRLYSFFDRFGFETVFYIDEQRFTAAHKFASADPEYFVEENFYDLDELAAAYVRLNEGRGATVLHTASDFKSILIDNSIEHGLKAVVRSRMDNSLSAFAIAVEHDRMVVVKSIHADSPHTADLALQSLRDRCPGKQFVVITRPGREGVDYFARGMARIVNVGGLLEAMASVNPEMKLTVRIQDRIIAENNGCFTVESGKVRKVTSRDEVGKIDYDVDISVFTAIAFSKPEIGELFNVPSQLPLIELMLE